MENQPFSEYRNAYPAKQCNWHLPQWRNLQTYCRQGLQLIRLNLKAGNATYFYAKIREIFHINNIYMSRRFNIRIMIIFVHEKF